MNGQPFDIRRDRQSGAVRRDGGRHVRSPSESAPHGVGPASPPPAPLTPPAPLAPLVPPVLANPPAPPRAVVLGAAVRRWQLTARQGEVLVLVAQGLTNELVADTLGIEKRTVEFHLSPIFDKVGVSNRTTLIARTMDLPAG